MSFDNLSAKNIQRQAPSNPVCDFRHHPGVHFHQGSDRQRQRRRSLAGGLIGMTRFVVAHDCDNGPASFIVYRKLVQVALQMAYDLAFGFFNETKTPVVSQSRRRQAHGERAREPEKVQPAGHRIELRKAFTAPTKMIAFLPGCFEHRQARSFISRQARLSDIERLGAHFAGMVHPHQAGGVPFIPGGQWRVRQRLRRRPPTLVTTGTRSRPQCGIEAHDGPIDGRQITHWEEVFSSAQNPLQNKEKPAKSRGFALTPPVALRTIAPLFSQSLNPA